MISKKRYFNDRGATLTEYAALVGLVFIVALAAVASVGERPKSTICALLMDGFEMQVEWNDGASVCLMDPDGGIGATVLF